VGRGGAIQSKESLVLGKVSRVSKGVAENEGLDPHALVLREHLCQIATQGSPEEVDLEGESERVGGGSQFET